VLVLLVKSWHCLLSHTSPCSSFVAVPSEGRRLGKKFYIIVAGGNKPRKPSAAFWQRQAALFVSLAPPTPSHQ
jgi:hypothetical protein